MRAHFAKLEGNAELAEDVRIESAWEHRHAADWERLALHVAGFPAHSPRYTEARYLEGLAHSHAGRKAQARALWRATIEACPQDC